jgi:transcriptional regulator with XRE-family HTH domain
VSDPDGPRSHQQSVSAQQLAMYGESWADRFGRLLAAFNISQSRLASVIGLSAPMMSQLITGQRVKISNPAVYGRIVRLEELLATPAVRMGDREQLAQLLAEVAASQPALTTLSSAAARESNVRGTPTADPAVIARQQVIRWLAANTTAAGRFAAADAAATVGDVRLAEVLRMN